MTPQSPFTVEQHVGLRRLSNLAVSPDGTWLAATLQRLDRHGSRYLSDLWRIPLNGDEPLQLTRGDSRDTAPCFRHDGALGFLSNRTPAETGNGEHDEDRSQIWLLAAGGGEPLQLTDEPLGIQQFRFARSVDRLVYLAPVLADVEYAQQRETADARRKHGANARHFTRQPVRHWDHWLHENADMANIHLVGCSAEGENRIDLTPEARREFSIEPDFDLTADGQHVVITAATPAADREEDTSLQLIDLENNVTRPIWAQAGSNIESPRFSPDGQQLAAVSSVRSAIHAPCPRLQLISVATGDCRELAGAWDCWPALQDWSRAGDALLVTADDDGVTPLFRVGVANGEVQQISDRSGSHQACIALADGGAAGIRSTLLQPPEPFLINAGGNGLAPLPGGLSGFETPDWAETESLSCTSSDGAPIQSWLIKPRGASAALPTLLWIHGGPMGMSGDLWHWRWNPLVFVALGYAVVQPNPRGSTGFGQEFIQGIWGNTWGGQCFQDLMAVTDAISVRPDIDAERIMAMGGSFGGYMSNWIGTQTDRFRCLVTHASIVNMATFTGVTDHPAWWYLEMGGEDPYRNPESFDRYAPWRQVDKWRTPTLIIHGERDYRCPVSEALMLFEALLVHDVDAELLLFPDECHFIEKPPNIIAWYSRIAEFLSRHMG
jgi:dipeptidyl aminopeptidase/acylaminoacyl peptidase